MTEERFRVWDKYGSSEQGRYGGRQEALRNVGSHRVPSAACPKSERTVSQRPIDERMERAQLPCPYQRDL